jgi:prophage antirepressor-like protein
VLGYANASDAINQHCKGVAKRYPLQTTGGIQEVRIINEPDTYRLITGSTLPEANRFESWLFEGVLPSIRKTGSYQLSDTKHDLPVIESSLVLDFQGVPIRFLIDAHGEWMATYADVATALGFVNKEQQYNARNILKYNVKAGQRQLRHPLYGDLINLAGLDRIMAQFARNAVCEPERAALAENLKGWLAQVAAPLVAKPASAGFLLSQHGQRALAYDPDYQQSAHLLTLWHDALGESPCRAADVLAQAQGPLVDALAEVARNRWFSTLLSAKRLGKWLSLRQGQAIDGLMISSIMDRCRKIRLWSVRKVAP